MASRILDRKRVSIIDIKQEKKKQEKRESLAEARQSKLSNLSEKDRLFRERMIANREKHKANADVECWVAVVFSSRVDKDKFISEFGLIDHPMIPGTPGNKYINGYTFAEHLRKMLTS